MATYLTVAEMALYFDKRILVKLSNDDPTLDPNNSANINSTVLELYIEDATNIVANFLRGIYTDVELNSSPTTEIQTIAAQLAWCGLWERRGQEPQQITDLRKRCYDRLHKMATPTSDQKRTAQGISKIATDDRM